MAESNYLSKYWNEYEDHELEAIINNDKLLRAFREEAKRRLSIRKQFKK